MNFERITYNIKNMPYEEIAGYRRIIENSFLKKTGGKNCVIKYLDLGVKTVRLEIFDEGFINLVEKNFAYCLKEKSSSFDVVFRLWRDDVNKYAADSLTQADNIFISHNERPVIKLYKKDNALSAYDTNADIFYFAANDLSKEFASKNGHIFIDFISEIVKTPDSALVHAACVGIENEGVLICGRGGRGKSTLAVSCLADGFQYISDDYLILNKTDMLYAYPVYSIVILSPQMHKKMYNLKSEFLWDNYNNTKYVFDVSSHHGNFVNKMPLRTVVFPEICPDLKEPFVEPVHKGKAITQLVYSTVYQTGEQKNADFLKQLISLVSGLDFYKINLSADLQANVKVLRKFINERSNNNV